MEVTGGRGRCRRAPLQVADDLAGAAALPRFCEWGGAGLSDRSVRVKTKYFETDVSFSGARKLIVI